MVAYKSPILANLTNEFLDTDFGFQAQTNNRVMGCLPSDPELMRGFQEYEASQKIYDRKDWPELFEQMDRAKAWNTSYIVKEDAHDQDGEPSCVYNMAAAMEEIIHNKQFGTAWHIQRSPISGYRWNGSPRSGSNIFDSSSWITGTGLLPTNNARNLALVKLGYFKHTHPHNGYNTSFQDGWKETAAFFRLQEWYRITTVEGWVSAYINGDVIGGGRDSHAILQALPALDGNKLFSIYLNSWGSWGNTLEVANGEFLRSFGVDSESKIIAMIRNGAYVGRTMIRPSWLSLAA